MTRRCRQILFHVDTQVDDLADIIEAACVLVDDMYSDRSTLDSLFKLRKALEGIFGHDLPTKNERD